MTAKQLLNSEHSEGTNTLDIKLTQWIFQLLHSPEHLSKPVVLSLWVGTPWGVQMTFLQGLPKTICISDIYLMIPNSGKIIVMK